MTPTIPPKFSDLNDVVTWCSQRVGAKSNVNWELSWAFSEYAPADDPGAEVKLHDIAFELNINPATAGRLRWMGSVWIPDIVNRFPRLQHTHFEYGTKILQKALKENDQATLEDLLDLFYLANEGEGKVNRKGDPHPWSVEKLKAEIRAKIEGKDSSDKSSKPAAVSGELFHGILADAEGVGYFVTAIIHSDEVAWKEAQEKLDASGLLGQYVTSVLKIDSNE